MMRKAKQVKRGKLLGKSKSNEVVIGSASMALYPGHGGVSDAARKIGGRYRRSGHDGEEDGGRQRPHPLFLRPL